jgi:hypothetical protein
VYLTNLRRQNLAVYLEATRARVTSYISQDRFEEAAETARNLAEEMGPEAQEIGMGPDLQQFRDSCEFLANLARQAGKR